MTWLGYKIYIFTDDEKLFTIRDTEPEKLLMLLIPGCLGIVQDLTATPYTSLKGRQMRPDMINMIYRDTQMAW